MLKLIEINDFVNFESVRDILNENGVNYNGMDLEFFMIIIMVVFEGILFDFVWGIVVME